MKKSLLFIIIVTSALVVNSHTNIPYGNVSGIWTMSGSPYNIQGNIQIPNDSTLTIEPGVTVNFQGTYRFEVKGRLLAIGTITDTICFTASDTSNGWNGIRFDELNNINDTSKFIFCKLQYGKATGAVPYNRGGAFYFYKWSKAIISHCSIKNCLANDAGGAICLFQNCNISILNNLISHNSAVGNNGGGGINCNNSNPIIIGNTIIHNSAIGHEGGGIIASGIPVITNNIISYNSCNSGGGIQCYGAPIIKNNIISYNVGTYGGGGINCNHAGPEISYNIISNNKTTLTLLGASGGGGISCGYNSTANISNNTISNNKAASTGGGITCSGSSPIIFNNTIVNNRASKGGALYCMDDSDPVFTNTILWGNSAISGSQVYIDDDPSNPDFFYCDIYGSDLAFNLNGNFYNGTYQNNINSDPNFVSPSTGAGNNHNGVIADWSIQDTSPCINSGNPVGTYPQYDLAGNPRIVYNIIDVGAYENQGHAGIAVNDLQKNYKIYPNPTTDYLFIENLNTNSETQIEIYNVNAQLLYSENFKDDSFSIDVSSFPKGLYFLKIISGDKIQLEKVVIQ